MKIYAIYDSKAEAYLKPFFCTNNAVAIRSFTQAVNQEGSDFNLHAGDYTLFAIGGWDEQTGHINGNKVKTDLGTAIQYITSTGETR